MLYFKLVLLYLLIFSIVIFFSKKLEFTDKPNDRKLHTKELINTSGISLYLYLLVIVNSFELSPKLEEVIIYGSIVVICGFIDDRFYLTPGVKLILTFLPVIYLINNDFNLVNLGTYEYIGKINLGKFGIIFTILACSLLIHSYNYIDGIDGLLLLVTITNICFGMFLLGSEEDNIFKLLIFILIPLIINLIFNILPNTNNLKIFMGDAGSLFIGFFMSFFMIYLYKFKNIHPANIIWISWYPIYDFLFMTIYRTSKKLRFYSADNKHFHHVLLRILNNSHLKCTFLISIMNLLIILIGFSVSHYLGKIYSLIVFVLIFLLFILIRIYTIKKYQHE
jgi:UDP-GlcNAc:undecaprenyl-phosphate GlcNAc-1-phosphate transferase